jgi:hypothetical protein
MLILSHQLNWTNNKNLFDPLLPKTDKRERAQKPTLANVLLILCYAKDSGKMPIVVSWPM